MGIVALASAEGVKYFPDLAFDAQNDIHKSIAGWYSKHLQAMKEPSLLNASSYDQAHMYRFLWLRTFHKPIALRLQVKPEGHGILTVKVCDGAAGYESGNLVIEDMTKLEADDVSSFLSSVEDAKFWNMPSYESEASIVCDGAQWVLEGVRNGRYHVVDRQSPREGTYRDACLMLLRFSELEVDEIY